MDPNDSSAATPADASARGQRREHLPNRLVGYCHKTKPPLPNKPRPPLPAKPNVSLSQGKPQTSKRNNGELASTNQRIILDSSGKGKAPPPPPPSSPPSSSSSPPQLPPKDTSPPPTPKKPTGEASPKSAPSSVNCTPVTVKKSPFSKNDIQTKILNSVRNNSNFNLDFNINNNISTTTNASSTYTSNDNNNNNNDNNSNINETVSENSRKLSSPKTNTQQGTSRKVFTRAKSTPPAPSPKTFTIRVAFGAGKSHSCSSSIAQSSNASNNDDNNNNIVQKIQSSEPNPVKTPASDCHESYNIEPRKTPPPPPVKPKPRPKPRERPVPKQRVSLLLRQNSVESVDGSSPGTSADHHSDDGLTNELNSSKNSNSSYNDNSVRPSNDTPIQLSETNPLANTSVKRESISNDIETVDASLRHVEECVNNILKSQENIDNLSSPERSRRQAPRVPVRDYKLRSSSVDRCSVSHSYHKNWSESSSKSLETEDQVQLPRKTRVNNSPFDLLVSGVNDPTPPKPPARPPRPKHEEIKRSRSKLTASDIQFMHVDFTSSQQAQELGAPTLTRQKSESRKPCPPKPLRKNLRRCRSDAADHRNKDNDIESSRSRTLSQPFQRDSEDMSMASSPPNKMINQPEPSSPNISKSPVPAPPRRWYGREQEQTKSPHSESDDVNSNCDVTSATDKTSSKVSSANHDTTDADTMDFFSSPQISCTYPAPVPRGKSKERTPTPPRVPPRNYTENDEAGETNTDNEEVFTPSKQCDDSSKEKSSESNKNSSDNSLKTDADMYSSNDNINKSPTFKHDRPLSSISQISLPSDSGSGSAEMQNNNSILSSGTDSSEEDEAEQAKSDRSAKKVYYIAEEIMSSEKIFVRILCLINVDFRLAVSNATEKAGRPVIPTDVLNRILNFLPQLQNFNEDLLSDLENRLKKWDSIQKIADIFVKKGPFLKLYTSYIRDFKNMQMLFEESCRKYPAFANAVKEFKSHPECQNLDLTHHMLKPVQRIPQYRLLLSEYLKYLTPDSPDYKDTLTALDIVSKVSEHANERIRQGDNVQKLMEVQYALIGNFEVIYPGRELIKMGELQKLSRKEMQPRVFILFNDTLLYTTPVPAGYKLINVLTLAGMKVKKTTLDDFKNEFNIISIQRSFTVCANTSAERDEWIDAISKAIEDNTLKRNSFEVNRTQVPSLEKGFVLGSKAPLWVPDARVTMCMLCTCEFTVTWRRHHCRACGRVTCGNCSNNKAPLLYLEYRPSRVCDECNKKLYEEVEQQVDEIKLAKEEGKKLENVLPDDLLSRFQRIRKSGRHGQKNIKRPAWLKEVHANDQGSTMSGYLKLYKGKRWKQLWFVLKDKVLYKYKASEDMAAIDSRPLLGYQVNRITEEAGDGSGSLSTNSNSSDPRARNQWYEGIERHLLFELTHSGMQPMRFQTDSAASTEKWVTVLLEASVP
ncbi:FYVE, RhoGEF and PH domain-containing protein 6 isoform X1 [Octopus sinensis]|uniref:FYVE, RhoGEF and PH domain-containing protein 6 isoform X1 n=1 Tax=Octopus sinensis TaxID=2607531 RepID=A0A6P7SWM5_9MOLL|nr:FYVE, RhoGEF and PH domain-containing protein 6 isoform X1 [Octopus sinensis]